ncbi:single-stranded DNA-binding protein [Tautonia plasticadhaerens]|uniref:Single-stranded DNA-binding protein n=1 Tax=Tautonia plasticadhaerens TaxID=2527974 RepID=A0A518GX64_9BACT|nr:single-stranded DNA-binding protein [Tautonia plasticadhaerens]QDV33171.1 Single-stranded DNA-binding protein ssb [Tautonia plasticadhaerens]
MADLNKVFLIGRLTHDPELRYTPSGAPVSDLRLATSRVFTTKEGDRREDTLYIDVSVWNRQAENCCQYLKKGSQIHVEGHLRMDSWEDRNSGEKRTKIRVEGERIQFLDTRRGGDDQGGGPPRSDVEYDEPPARRAPSGGGGGEPRGGANGSGPRPYAPPPRRPAAGSEEPADEDIPF